MEKIKSHMNTVAKAIARRVPSLFKKNPGRILKKITGVIHVGANTGQ